MQCLALCAVLCLGTTGCSFIFVTDAPSDPSEQTAQGPEECTTSRFWPVVDTIAVPTSAINAAYLAQSEDIEDGTKPLLVAAHIAWAGVYAASAIYGYTATSRCSKLQRELDAAASGPRWKPAIKDDATK